MLTTINGLYNPHLLLLKGPPRFLAKILTRFLTRFLARFSTRVFGSKNTVYRSTGAEKYSVYLLGQKIHEKSKKSISLFFFGDDPAPLGAVSSPKYPGKLY